MAGAMRLALEKAGGKTPFAITGNKAKTNAWDLSDLGMVEGATPSDGAIPVCASHFGKVLRNDYPWNHIDEMNKEMEQAANMELPDEEDDL